jgi:molybdopterin-binding protein
VTRVDGDLATVECGEVVLQAPAGSTTPGDRVFVVVEARDVLLAVGEIPRTSARNVLPGRVEALHGEGARIAVRVDAGIPLWAEVTGSAVGDLALAPGRPVQVLLKARALRTVDRP